MRLHEWYKCEHCPEFHPVELDLFLKAHTRENIPDFARKEMEMVNNSNDYMYTVLDTILKTSSLHEVGQQFNQLDKNFARAKVLDASQNFDHRTAQLATRNYKMFESERQMVMHIKRNQRICVRTMKNMFEGARPHLCRAVEIFTSNPSEQWKEVTDFKMKVKPLWFTGNRIYQFLTRIVLIVLEGLYTRYECKVMLDGEVIEILTFSLRVSGYPCHAHWSAKGPSLEQTKVWLLPWQSDPNKFAYAFTGKPTVCSSLHNLYYLRVTALLLRRQ